MQRTRFNQVGGALRASGSSPVSHSDHHPVLVSAYQILAADFLVVVKFQKFVAAVTRHVNEHAACVAASQAFGNGPPRRMPPGQDAHKVFNCYFFVFVVYFQAVCTEVYRVGGRMVYPA